MTCCNFSLSEEGYREEVDFWISRACFLPYAAIPLDENSTWSISSCQLSRNSQSNSSTTNDLSSIPSALGSRHESECKGGTCCMCEISVPFNCGGKSPPCDYLTPNQIWEHYNCTESTTSTQGMEVDTKFFIWLIYVVLELPDAVSSPEVGHQGSARNEAECGVTIPIPNKVTISS